MLDVPPSCMSDAILYARQVAADALWKHTQLHTLCYDCNVFIQNTLQTLKSKNIDFKSKISHCLLH